MTLPLFTFVRRRLFILFCFCNVVARVRLFDVWKMRRKNLATTVFDSPRFLRLILLGSRDDVEGCSEFLKAGSVKWLCGYVCLHLMGRDSVNGDRVIRYMMLQIMMTNIYVFSPLGWCFARGN